MKPFSNEPVADFTVRKTRIDFRNALTEAGNRMRERYPAVIGGKEYRQGEPIVSVDPARPREVVGTACGITRELADHAVGAAREAQKGWSQRSPGDRAAVLFRAASVARRRRGELAAWQVREVGKSWLEADADVAEAIDYLEYYGREMIRLGKAARLGDCPGEGYYVSPTVLTDLPPNSKILREEIFGPVLAVIRAGDIEEAVGLANSSDDALTGEDGGSRSVACHYLPPRAARYTETRGGAPCGCDGFPGGSSSAARRGPGGSSTR